MQGTYCKPTESGQESGQTQRPEGPGQPAQVHVTRDAHSTAVQLSEPLLRVHPFGWCESETSPGLTHSICPINVCAIKGTELQS